MLPQGSISVNRVVAQAAEGQASNGDVPQMSRAPVHQGRPQVQVEDKALTQLVSRETGPSHVILADSSLIDLSRSEGAESEASGGPGTFWVTDTAPERVLRCAPFFTVW